MAGSKRWFAYTTNANNGNQVFGIEADESNTEEANNAEPTLPNPSPIFSIPRNLRPRRAVFKNADGATKIAYILTPARFAAINLNDATIIDGYTLVRKIDESFSRNVVNIDTGQTDGDSEGEPPANP